MVKGIMKKAVLSGIIAVLTGCTTTPSQETLQVVEQTTKQVLTVTVKKFATDEEVTNACSALLGVDKPYKGCAKRNLKEGTCEIIVPKYVVYFDVIPYHTSQVFEHELEHCKKGKTHEYDVFDLDI